MKKTGLDKEMKICTDHEKQGYCYWGVCRFCGVKQFIRKLQTGEIEHNKGKHEKFMGIAKSKQ